MPEVKWNANVYDDKYAFVSKYGEDLIGWLDPQKGESILDLGCGTGQLASEIAGSGARVRGFDYAEPMIERARANYPELAFDIMDAREFYYEEPFDAVFSNAALHWINDPEAVIGCMYRALRPGGRLVIEMGGKGNVQDIVQAIDEAMWEAGWRERLPNDFWYFPSIGEYSTLLEQGGFQVNTALHFDRETVLAGDKGMQNWIRMFGGFFFQHLQQEEADKIIFRAVELLRPGHFRGGNWYADYKRLRIKAVRPTGPDIALNS
jgi:trans-aconitate methyltransferase